MNLSKKWFLNLLVEIEFGVLGMFFVQSNFRAAGYVGQGFGGRSQNVELISQARQHHIKASGQMGVE